MRVEACGMPTAEWSGPAGTFGMTLTREVNDAMASWHVRSAAVGMWLRMTRAQLPSDGQARAVLEFDQSAGLLSFDAWVGDTRIYGADDWIG